METNENEENKSLKAKILSKSAMIFSSAWIAVLTILKSLNYINLDISEIVISGVMITAVWTPTFISIVVDKFTNKL